VNRLRLTAHVIVFAALAALAGCGGDPLYDVTGTVTYDGKPLPAGVVWFDPDPTNTDAPQGFAYVKDGQFDTAQNGRGVRGGAYVIRIEGFDGKPANELPLGRPLFTDFREKRDLPRQKAELQLTVPKSK
jgi:hypothetical protein